MSQRDALPILIDVARALGAAHRKGIVHRDIKPGNILLHENHAVVADFGVAKALTASVSDSTGLTTSGLAVGTPAYMSPEQAAGDATVDGRADIYALGCVAYELLSGKPPFTDPSMARLLVAQVSQVPVPLAQVAPVRSGMAAAIMRCLAKDPAERWPTADALADALEQQRFTAEMPLPVPPPTSPVATERAGDGSATLPPRRRGLVGGGLAVALVIGVAVALSSGRGGPKTAVAFDAPQTVIVADVDNRTADSTLGDLVSEALRTELRESKLVTVMTPSATAEALQRMQRPNVQRIPAVLAREIAVREGVPLVVEGRIQKVGNTYLVRAALVSSADGAEQTAVQETATSEDGLIAAIGRTRADGARHDHIAGGTAQVHRSDAHRRCPARGAFPRARDRVAAGGGRPRLHLRDGVASTRRATDAAGRRQLRGGAAEAGPGGAHARLRVARTTVAGGARTGGSCLLQRCGGRSAARHSRV
jgi:serine/threonine-protein kinase